MVTRGEFRHDSAVSTMDIVLIGDRACAHYRLAGQFGFDYGRGRVVTRRFNAENNHEIVTTMQAMVVSSTIMLAGSPRFHQHAQINRFAARLSLQRFCAGG